jgi:HSP20 family protein
MRLISGHQTTERGDLMTLIKREDLMWPFEDRLNKVLDNFFGKSVSSNLRNEIKSRSSYPKLDVYEKDDQYRIDVAIPGVDPDEIKVEVYPEGGQRFMRIRGGMSSEHRHSDANYSMKELRRSSFSRILVLPSELEDQEPEATYKNGMLHLVWNIDKRSENHKSIPIKKEE